MEELYREEIQKSARILRSNQQALADKISREWFETEDDKINQNLCELVALESWKHFKMRNKAATN